MDWQQSSKAFVIIGTIFLLLLTIAFVLFVISYKRKLSRKDSEIRFLETKNEPEVNKLRDELESLKKETEQLKKEKIDKKQSPPSSA